MAMIQWFPGHMAKALRQIREQMHLVDIVFELVDARVPYSTQNPEIARAMGDKPHLLILTKTDLADPAITKQWIDYFKEHKQPVLALDSRDHNVSKTVSRAAARILRPKAEQQQAKGMRQRAMRAMCVGVPNVGKSTLLNHLVKKNVASTGNRPGVTTGQQWLRSGKDLELLDTPGVLWPKFSSERQGNLLALTGAIRDGIYAKDDVALFALEYLRQHRLPELMKRYRLSEGQVDPSVGNPDLLMTMTAKMGFRDDYERGSDRLIWDLRKGKLGSISLETPAEIEQEAAND